MNNKKEIYVPTRLRDCLAIILILSMHISALKINKISDNSLSLLNNGLHSIILFTLQNHQNYQSLQPIKQKIKGYCQDYNALVQCKKWQFIEAQLSRNQYLQQKFNVKRFPYLGFYFNQAQITNEINGKFQFPKIYKFRGIVSQDNVIGVISRILNYQKMINNLFTNSQNITFSFPQADQRTVKIQINMNKIGKNRQQHLDFLDFLVNKVLFNDIYSEIHFIIENPQKQQTNQTAQNNSIVLCSPLIQSGIISFKEMDEQLINSAISQINFNLINQFTAELFSAFQSHFNGFENQQKQFTFALILDSVFRRQVTINQYIPLIQKIQAKWRDHITIFWMEAAINSHKKVLLGFEKNASPPLFALFNPREKSIPMQGQFTQTNINKFISSHISKSVNSSSLFKNLLMKLQEQENDHIFISDQIELKQGKYFDQKRSYIVYWVNFKAIANKSALLKELIYTLNRVNRFIIDQDKQLYLVLQDSTQNSYKVKQGLQINYGKSKSIITMHNIVNQQQSHQICQQVQQSLKRQGLSLPKYACIQEFSMQNYLIKID